MKITLCGFMGCGKTTKGKILAERLGIDFFDSDFLVEQTEKRTINEIFAADGEEYFRRCEGEAIKQLACGEGDCVISVGGGAVMNAENADILRKNSTVVFIETPVEVICERLSTDSSRPLFNVENVRELYQKRLPFYKEAADIIVSDNSSAEETVDEIVRLLG